jgi:hypothetical protein
MQNKNGFGKLCYMVAGIFCQVALVPKNLQLQSHQSLSAQRQIAVNLSQKAHNGTGNK